MSTRFPKSSLIKIANTDLISGRQYLRLLHDFKTYDARRKKYMNQLLKHIEFLSEEHPEREAFYRDWHSSQHYREMINRLLATNESLTQRCIRLESELKALLERIDNLSESI